MPSLFIIIKEALGVKVKLKDFFLSFALVYLSALLILLYALGKASLTLFLTSGFRL